MWRHYDSEFADCMGWTWPVDYWQGDQAVAHPPNCLRAYVEAKGGNYFDHKL